jgi:hypothetical protein
MLYVASQQLYYYGFMYGCSEIFSFSGIYTKHLTVYSLAIHDDTSIKAHRTIFSKIIFHPYIKNIQTVIPK